MQKVLDFFKNIFRFHKLKIFSVFVFAVVFGLLLFPFGDLSDLVTAKVSEATQNRLYVQFDGMGLSLASGLGLEMDNVVIESQQFPSINASTLSVSPWILGALAARKGANVNAEGLFKGNVHVVYREGDKLKSEARLQNIDLEAQQVALAALSDFLRSGNIVPISMQGSLDLSTNLAVDPTFGEQPNGTIGMNIAGFTLPSQSFNTQMGPMQSPALRLGKVALKAKLAKGRLEIEDMTFGGSKDDLSGRLRGELGLAFQPDGQGSVRPVVNSYDLRVDLTASKAFMDPTLNPASGLLSGFLGPYKSETPAGTRFAFRVRPPKMPGLPPEFSSFQ